jgi:hypothetical protein
MSPLLQIFLIVNAIAVGVIATIAIQHARAHFKKQEVGKKTDPTNLPRLSGERRQQLLEEAEVEFRKQIDASVDSLRKDLTGTADELAHYVTKVGGEIIETEMKRYRETIDSLRKQTEAIINQAQTGVARHQSDISERITSLQNEMETKLKDEIAADKKLLTDQIDTKLADAVSSFLVETLQHEVDLGAQSEYLVRQLEAHKEELIKEVRDEA